MKIRILFIAFLVSSLSFGQIIYQDNFGTTAITSKPYTGTPTSSDPNISSFSWTTSVVNFSGLAGNGGAPSQSLSVANSSGTPTYTFTFNVAAGYELAVTQFDFWRVRSTTGAQNWSMTINGTNVGTGTVPTTGASLGATNVSTPINSLTGTITVVLTCSGASGTGTFRLDDFTLYGAVTSTTACSTPTTQATGLTSNTVTTTTANLSWTDGASTSGSLVSLRLTANPIVAPTSGTNYTPTTTFSTAAGANLINANNVVVAKNATGSVTGISGLAAGTQYTATPYAYNGSGTNVCFNTTNPESFSFYTLSLEPTSSPATLTCGASTLTSITLNFPAYSPAITNATGYVLIYRIGAAPTGMPVDGTVYAPNSIIGDSTFYNYISSPIATSVNVTGLNSGTVYYFALIPYGSNVSSETLNYRTTALTTTNCNTTPAPEINVKGVVGANPTITDGDITPSGLDNTLYGTVVVGSPLTKSFRIENTGNAALTINSISMVGGNAGDFTIPALTFPFSIAAASSFDLAVTFTPGAAGTRNTTLTIGNTDSNEGTYDFLIQGTGTATPIVEINVKGNGQSIPDNSIYPQGTNWTYFPVTLQGGSSSRIFTIENLGSTNLSLTGAPTIQITGAHASQFSVSTVSPPSTSISGGGTTTFQIDFNPTSGGSKNATIIIASNDSDENPYNFNISGTCQGSNNIYVSGNGYDVPKASVTTSTTNLTNFGLIPVTTGLKQNTFIITNLAGATRYLNNVTITGADASMFTVVSQPNNGAFSSGNTTSFTINFTPTSSGVKNATVNFNVYTNSGRTTLDSVDGTFTFAISGEGIVYTPCSNNSVQTIALVDFEPTPGTPTWAYTQATDGTVNITGGTFNNGSGAVNAFVGTRSYQFRGIGTTTTRSAVINLSSQDVSQYNNINFSMRVGAFRASGTTQGLDLNELVQVETSTDGVNWSVESVLRGYTNSRWSFAATGVFNAYYTGNNSGVTVDTRLGNAELTGAAGISTYYVRNLPQSPTLQIRITLNVDRDDELWAIDDIKLEGQTAQSTTWNGAAWTAGFPTPSTKAIFDGDYTTTPAVNHGSVEACECQINSGRNVTVDSGYYMEIQSNITNNGNLTIADDGSLVQINDAATNVGNITYQRTATGVRGSDYVYWSSPVVGQSVTGLYSAPTTPGFIYRWGPTAANINSPVSSGNWQAYTGTMGVGEGYIVRGSSNYNLAATSIPASFFGEVNNGVVPVSISRNNNTTATTPGPGNGISISNYDDNWNLVGNPYPSAIRSLDFLNANNTNLMGFVYIWTHSTAPATIINPFYGSYLYNYTTTDYITYNGTGTTSGPSGFNGYIAGGQGFFVMMNDGSASSATINFKNSMRNKTYNNSQFYKATPIGNDEKHRIWLDLVNANNQSVRTLVGYVSEATNDLDWLYDAFKNTANSFEIYSLAEGQTVTIQGRQVPFDSNDTVPIGVRIMQVGEHKIAIAAVDGLFSDSSQNIYLEDKLLGVIHDLRQNPYSFNATAGIINDRFILRYNTTALGNPDFGTADNNVIVTTNQGQLGIKSAVEMISEVTVFDILGRQLFDAKSVGSKDFTTSKISISQQALIVKIKLENGTIVTRKIVL